MINTLLCYYYEVSEAIRAGNIYLGGDVYSAMAWLKNQEPEPKIILSKPLTSVYIPAFASQKVIVGNKSESYLYKPKLENIKIFFEQDYDPNIHDTIIAEYQVDYLFWGKLERENSHLQPQQVRAWEMVYQQGDVEIYKIQ